MEDSRFDLVVVAFMRSAGGRVRLLLAVDRDGQQLFEGEPALLAEYRPRSPASELVIEGADRIPAAAILKVHARTHLALAALVETGFDDTGAFDGQRVLGAGVAMRGDCSLFGE